MERGALPEMSAASGADDAAPEAGLRACAAQEPAVTLFVCTTCRAPDAQADAPRAGARLAAAAKAAAHATAPGDIAVKGVSCLANCKRSLSAAVARRDGWTYVFGDLSASSAPDLVTGARLLAGAPDGLMPWRGRPDALKRGMVARIPPLTFSEEP